MWGRTKSILMGHSRGRNLIVLGVFLFAMAAVIDTIQKALVEADNDSNSIAIAAIFVFAGMIAFIAGIQDYRSGD